MYLQTLISKEENLILKHRKENDCDKRRVNKCI